ncbi:hypothetical protein, partial [Duncaniella muris]|uniref:hypothetical protein n=1 Tax=Duncaniella muris TaxID=2094150 RepID=UPI002714BBAA
ARIIAPKRGPDGITFASSSPKSPAPLTLSTVTPAMKTLTSSHRHPRPTVSPQALRPLQSIAESAYVT